MFYHSIYIFAFIKCKKPSDGESYRQKVIEKVPTF